MEWGFADGQFYILQSRPITSLYPVPPVSDNQLHVFINFGYIQMMTDPMKPLAISVLSRLLHFIKKNPASSEPYILHHAGGRMFADFTAPLSIRPVRNRMLKIFKGMDESIASALEEVMSREAFRHRSIPIGTILRTVSKLAPIIIPLALKVINHRFVQDPAKANRKASALLIVSLVKPGSMYFPPQGRTGFARSGRVSRKCQGDSQSGRLFYCRCPGFRNA